MTVTVSQVHVVRQSLYSKPLLAPGCLLNAADPIPLSTLSHSKYTVDRKRLLLVVAYSKVFFCSWLSSRRRRSCLTSSALLSRKNTTSISRSLRRINSKKRPEAISQIRLTKRRRLHEPREVTSLTLKALAWSRSIKLERIEWDCNQEMYTFICYSCTNACTFITSQIQHSISTRTP